MTQALYRRYRPESFQEVIGQEHVIQPLMAALAAGKTTHAYLFSGPRGCGKTTSARILARCLNCAQYPTSTPCGECDSCRELARDGSGSLDVVELDAASHGGVDDARELREQAGFAPVRDRFKIYIIDEAHMVSNQGFNALLKLVEEPPPHVKFIFATTEPEKVIGTIRSRTHHYPFRLVPPNTLEAYLEQLCTDEGVSAGKDVLSLAVRAGTGSVRDTLSVLDQLIGGSDGSEIEYSRAVALLGYTSAHLLDNAVTAISDASGAALFDVVDSVVRSGHDPRRFVEDLLQRLRDIVIIALAGDSAKDVFLSVPEDQYELMVQQASALGASRASQCADLVNDALTKMVGATAPRMQLELLCARLLVASQTNVSLADAKTAGASQATSSQAGIRQTNGAERSEGHGSAEEGDGVGGHGSFRDGTAAKRADAPMGAAGIGSAKAAWSSVQKDTSPRGRSIQDPRSCPMPSFMPSVPPANSEDASRSALDSASEDSHTNSHTRNAVVSDSDPVSDTAAKVSAGGRPSGSVAGSPAPSSRESLPTPEQVEMAPVQHTQAGNASDNDMHGNHSLGTIRAQWAQIVQSASDESRIAANMLKQATGPLEYHDGTLIVGFANEGTAAGFNRQQKVQAALAHAIQQTAGVVVQIEGRAGEPAPDTRPKDDSAEPSLRANSPLPEENLPAGVAADNLVQVTPLPEEIPPEEDPIYEIVRQEDQAECDPAGVLAPLLDGSASIRDGRAQSSPEMRSLENVSSADVSAAYLAPDMAHATAARPLREDLELGDMPFYEQDMPAPPPAELPQSLAERYGAPESSQRSASRFQGWNGSSESELGDYSGSGNQGRTAGWPLGSHVALGQESEPESVQEFENPWDEVSDDDPEISQSSVVGINVVLRVLKGSVMEEIPRE